TPPFWGTRVVRGLPLDEVAAYINPIALFRNQWGFQPDNFDEARAALRRTLDMCRAEQLLRPEVVYGYWPASADGDDLIVWEGPDSDEVAARFSFPRQRKGKHLCVADYFRPIE